MCRPDGDITGEEAKADAEMEAEVEAEAGIVGIDDVEGMRSTIKVSAKVGS